ncbi:endonuclease/exonuclease/phosphatase family protein [Virgibacillus siamensis]|uniref:Endonuclease/exonuclease/phosphatase family protein n=1 Tax=Virgibacillus siamensis TaxID=480071 RepID=A0ABN1G477_9BACI
MKKLSILTWNLRQGGKKASKQIVASLTRHQANVMVLTEFKNNQTGTFILSELRDAGWDYIQTSNPPHKEHGVAIISSFQLMEQKPPFSGKYGAHRWNEVYIPSLHLYLLGVHVPNVNETYDKTFHWEQIMKYADRRTSDRCVIIGDFNTALLNERSAAPLKYSSYITALLDNGWADAWRLCNRNSTDYTWFSHKHNGYRLDYIFLSPPLKRTPSICDISHHERRQNYSDHAVLIAELVKI